MRYRWIASGVILLGFILITYLHNESAQRALMAQVATPEGGLAATSDTYAWLDAEVEALRRMRSLLDTLDAAGFRTDIGTSLRSQNRTSLEQMERLKFLTWLQDTMWGQTLYNLIWGVLGAAVLLPLAFWMDSRPPRQKKPRKPDDPGPSGDA